MTNMANRSTLLVARTFMNRICFGGGDPGHVQAEIDERNAVARCARVLASQAVR